MFKRLIAIIVFAGLCMDLFAQHGPQQYYPETDPIVLQKLEKWQDLKFGLLMHWGPYSQWGIVESWSLCSEDVGWTRRTKGRYKNYGQYKIDYENLKTTFNPVRFDPQKWAKAAKAAGMKYVVFTTKHHDGFCMFDSNYTDPNPTGIVNITGGLTFPLLIEMQITISKNILIAGKNLCSTLIIKLLS
jgi:alpha-L-fucosidase